MFGLLPLEQNHKSEKKKKEKRKSHGSRLLLLLIKFGKFVFSCYIRMEGFFSDRKLRLLYMSELSMMQPPNPAKKRF
jgi:hypothetical protein